MKTHTHFIGATQRNLFVSAFMIALSVLVLAGVLYVVGTQWLIQYKNQLVNEAQYQCAQSSRYQTQDGKSIVWYPVNELYLKCLKEKQL